MNDDHKSDIHLLALLCSSAVYEDKVQDAFKDKRFPLISCEFVNYEVVDFPSCPTLRILITKTLWNGRSLYFVSFRGTRPNLKDWLYNLKITANFDMKGVVGSSHAGFTELAGFVDINSFGNLVINDQRESTGNQIIFCGHSLGGAVASICTILLLSSLPPHLRKPETVSCVSFGSPLIIDTRLLLMK